MRRVKECNPILRGREPELLSKHQARLPFSPSASLSAGARPRPAHSKAAQLNSFPSKLCIESYNNSTEEFDLPSRNRVPFPFSRFTVGGQSHLRLAPSYVGTVHYVINFCPNLCPITFNHPPSTTTSQRANYIREDKRWRLGIRFA